MNLSWLWIIPLLILIMIIRDIILWYPIHLHDRMDKKTRYRWFKLRIAGLLVMTAGLLTIQLSLRARGISNSDGGNSLDFFFRKVLMDPVCLLGLLICVSTFYFIHLSQKLTRDLEDSH